MYMLVFVMIILTVLGFYTQVYTRNVTEGIEQQHGLADAMIQWHVTATSLVDRFAYPAGSLSASGCWLTDMSGLSTARPQCGAARVSNVNTASPTPVCGARVSATPPVPSCVVLLPQGYAYRNPYRFFSFAFRSAGGHTYVVTYLPPLTGPDPFGTESICFRHNVPTPLAACPSDQRLSSSFRALYQQMGKAALTSAYKYGIVNAGVLTAGQYFEVVGGVRTTRTITYRLPATMQVPNGSLAMITQVLPCGSCD